MNNWRNYELVAIIGQDMPPSQVDECISGISDSIKKLEGKIVGIDKCGLRILAYEINKNKRGHYILFKLNLTPKAKDEIHYQLRFDKSIIRYLFVKVEEFAENRLVFNHKDEDSSKSADSLFLDYKDVYGLKKYMNMVSKILSRRVTKLSMKEQKIVAKEISKARFLALLSYGA